MNVIKIIKKHGLMVLFFILLIGFVYFKTWWGVGGLFLFITALQIIRTIAFFKSFPVIKNMMLKSVKSWEKVQLGYDLDDPYWEGKIRPTRLQKLRGINPNMTKQENLIRRDNNKQLQKSLGFKEKYLNIFDYATGSKAIFLVLSITAAIVMLKAGINIILVFVIIILAGILKKRIDSKLLAKNRKV